MAATARDLKAFTEEESWLREAFGEVRSVIVVAPNGDAEYTAQMPQVYDMKLRTTPDGRSMTTLLPLEGRGNDWKGTYTSLFSQVCDHGANFEGSRGPARVLYRYRQRSGQDPSVIQTGQEYEQIGMFSPLHDHDDPDLSDFDILTVDTENRIIEDRGFSYHTHLIIEQPDSSRA